MTRLADAWRVITGKSLGDPQPGAEHIIPVNMNNMPAPVRMSFEAAAWYDDLVSAAIDFWGTNLSEAPLVAVDENGPDYTHALSQAFARPNDWYSQSEVWRFVAMQLATSPNGAYLLVQLNAMRQIAGIWPKSASEVRPIRSSTMFISGWELRTGGGWYPAPDGVVIVPFRFIHPDPAKMWESWPPVEAAKRALRTDAEAGRWLDFILQNMGQLSALVGVEGAEPGTAKEIQDKINTEYTGAENAGKVGVIGAKLTMLQLGLDWDKLDFGSLKDRMELAVARAFGIPAELLQILATASQGEGLSGNAYREKVKVFYKNKGLPIMHMLEEKAGLVLGQQYGLSAEQVKFDLSSLDLLDDSALEKAQKAAAARSFASVNERRAWLGLDRREEPEADDIPELRPNPFAAFGQTGALSDTVPEVKRFDANAWDAKAATHETPYVAANKKLLAAERDRAAKAVAAGDEYRFDAKAYAKAMLPIISKTFVDGGQTVAGELSTAKGTRPGESKAEPIDIAFDVTDPRAVAAVAKRVTNLTGNVSATTEAMVREFVRQGVEDGATLNEVSKLIADASGIGPLATKTVEQRAAMIARTESIGAMNAGGFEGAAQAEDLGLAVTKEWLTAGDGEVRDSHADLDGATVPYDQPFGNGLMYPGDESGDASSVVNCRCSLAYSSE